MEDNTEAAEEKGPPANPQKDSKLFTRWDEKLKRSEEYFRDWFTDSKKIIGRYRGDRDVNVGEDERKPRYNMYWSNIETVKPALYARDPDPVVDRRFKDKDPVGLGAAQLLQRSLEFCVDNYPFGQSVKAARDDYLLTARGQCRVRYQPYFETVDIAIDETTGKPIQQEQKVYEEVLTEFVLYKHFLHDPQPQWEQVKWVSFEYHLGRKELVSRFGEELGKTIVLDYKRDDKDREDNKEQEDKAQIFEIWDKENRKVIWVSRSYRDGVLDLKEDPLRLRDFFPCPKPLYGTMTNDSAIPVPDYTLIEDQARELDLITARIKALTKALKVAGVYDKSLEADLTQLFEDTKDNDLIAVNWPTWTQSGGLKNVIEYLPIKEVGVVLVQLYEARDRLKADLYELTGIADVVRGNSDPRETATAGRIKEKFVTLRLSEKQNEIARFARDLIALKGEIISEHFDPSTMKMIAGADLMLENGQKVDFDACLRLLKNDVLRNYRIDIETDSTIAIDEAAEKENAEEFVTAVGTFLQKSVPLIQQLPTMAPVLFEMLTFSVRRFRAGRELEAKIEQSLGETLNYLQQMAQQSQQQPNPEMIQAQIKAETEKAKLSIEANKAETQARLEEQRLINEYQIKREELLLDYQTKLQQIKTDAAMRAFEAEREPVSAPSV